MKKLIVLLSLSILANMVIAACPRADINGDCEVNLQDLAIMASEWLTQGFPEDPADMVWVSIDDDGSGMKDENGNSISQGGFTGLMSKYETTNAQYCKFLNAALASGDITVGADNIVYGADGSNSGDDFTAEVYFYTHAADPCSQITYTEGVFRVRARDGYDMGNHPVVMVSWYGASAFCNYFGYRLPTEWQWQAAADYDGSYIYGCGTAIDSDKANYNSENPLNLSAHPYTTPVNYYPSFGYGLNDLTGNVSEWTSSTDGSNAVVRGGGWNFGSGGLGSWCIWYIYGDKNQGSTFSDIGFRVCSD